MGVLVLSGKRSGDRPIHDVIPDVRDGLTRPERIVLWQLSETQKELGGRSVPTAMLYGRGRRVHQHQ